MQINKSVIYLIWISGGFFLYSGTVSKLVSKGVRSHPKILSSIYKEQAKDFVHRQNIDKYKPQISVSAEWGQENYKYEYPDQDIWTHDRYYTYGITFSQTIVNVPLLKMIRDARLKRELATLQSRDQQAKLVVKIAQTAVELIRISHIKSLAKENTQLYKKIYLDAKSKFKMKLLNSAEVAKLRAKWKRAVGELAKLNQMYIFTKNNLKFLANVKSLPKSLPKKRFYVNKIKRRYNSKRLKSCLRRVRYNTNVRIANKYCKVAENLISARKAERYPKVNLEATYRDGDWGDRVEKEDSSKIYLKMNMPVYQGGYIKDRVNEAKVLYFSARQDLNNAKLEAKISIQKSWEQIRSNIETLKAIKSAEIASKQYYDTTLIARKNGLQSLRDVYSAKIEYNNVIRDRVNFETQILYGILSLYYATGKATSKQIAKFEKSYLK